MTRRVRRITKRKSQRSSSIWSKQEFRSPHTGRLMTVWYDPRTGYSIGMARTADGYDVIVNSPRGRMVKEIEDIATKKHALSIVRKMQGAYELK